jgi:DNA-binding GntR family transcriptional regulator
MKQMRDSVIRSAYNRLRNDITFGQFKPGARLSEKLLSREYNVSRASIREVIGQLASQGYLTVEPNRGAVVTKLSLEDIDVTYQILVRCESLAASLFVNKPNKDVIGKLKGWHEKMKDDPFDSRSWLQLNDSFHEDISANCGSSVLSDLIYHTRHRIYRYRMVETDSEIMKIYNGHHEEILSALCDGNGKKSEALMRKHLEVARKNRFEVFRKFSDLL